MHIIMSIGYHEDPIKASFGYFKNGKYIPQSNFWFELVAEVVFQTAPQQSGFLLSVKKEFERSDNSRYNYTIQCNHCVYYTSILHFIQNLFCDKLLY